MITKIRDVMQAAWLSVRLSVGRLKPGEIMDAVGLVGVFVVGVVIVVITFLAAPTIVVWTINTLFPVAAIPYTPRTLVAAMIIIILFRSKTNSTKEE